LLCPDCEVIRTKRSRHCSICNKCVERFDHHCPWINNCVGTKNHGSFMLFLSSISVTLIMTFVTVTSNIYAYNNVPNGFLTFFPLYVYDKIMYLTAGSVIIAITGFFIIPVLLLTGI
jgi:hypothetical protein